MLFHEATYPIFLALLFVAFWVVARMGRVRTGLLVAASYAFYFYGTYTSAEEQTPPIGALPWSFLCLGIVFVGSTLDYYVAHAIERAPTKARKKAWLLLSIGYYLGVLALFKYLDFFIGAFADAARMLGVPLHPKTLGLILPFGISFFTFETMSYTIDVYRGELKPHARYGEYLLFVCFFPHLVAGPIVRPRSFLPQLAAVPVFDEHQHGEGQVEQAQVRVHVLEEGHGQGGGVRGLEDQEGDGRPGHQDLARELGLGADALVLLLK
jgi:D-alanyl-lipoteichoic acid acyltransferase DltB (MBOAT superfamily)